MLGGVCNREFTWLEFRMFEIEGSELKQQQVVRKTNGTWEGGESSLFLEQGDLRKGKGV